MKIGCHLSSSKGFLAMGLEALKLGANTFQFFTRNPRGSQAKAIDPADVRAFLDLAGQNRFAKVVAHAPYTLNACAAVGTEAGNRTHARTSAIRCEIYVPYVPIADAYKSVMPFTAFCRLLPEPRACHVCHCIPNIL